MKKKIIALTLIFAMLVPFVPAAAAEETAARPTVEEILSQYHQAAFEAEMNGEEAAAYSPRSGSNEPTLEQQTVETLNEAGYEAYNVTADNYDTLEAQLHTDFADMGLDPEGSYIVVIHGEEQPQNGNARLGDLILPPHLRDDGSNPGSPSEFQHTYDGNTYRMRYMTITASYESQLGRTRAVDLFTDLSGDELMSALDIPISIYTAFVNFYGLPLVVESSCTLLSMISSDAPLSQTISLAYTGSANWTIKYTQVWSAQESKWKVAASVEYVKKRFSTTCAYYSAASNQYEYKIKTGDLDTEYSDYYNDTEMLKDMAVIAFNEGARYQSKITSVTFNYRGEDVITHMRWSEGVDFEL